MKKIVSQILFILILNANALSQDVDFELGESLEITGDNGDSPYLVSLEENGLLWIRQEKKNGELTGRIAAVLYDRDLRKHEKVSYQLEGKKLDGYSQSFYLKELNQYFIFVNRQRQKDDIICFDVKKGTFQSFKVDLDAGIAWNKQPVFKVVNIDNKPNMLVFENGNYFLSEIDLLNGVLINKQLPEYFTNKKLLSIEQLGGERFLINYFSNANMTNFAIIDRELKLILSEVLNFKTDFKNEHSASPSSGGIAITRNILSFYNYSFLQTENGLYLSGLYSNGDIGGNSGFFAARLEDNKVVFCNQYTFKELKHFFDFSTKKEKLISLAEKDKYFFPGVASSFRPFSSEGYIILSYNNYNTEDPSTIVFLKVDPENGKMKNDLSIAIKGFNVLNMSTDSLENAYYFSCNDEKLDCITYFEGEANDGDDFKLNKFFEDGETLYRFFTDGLYKWYGDYYYLVTTKKKGSESSYYLKKIKLILR